MLQELAVAGQFIVKTKPLAAVADFDESRIEFMPFTRRGICGRSEGFVVSRKKWISAKQVQNIGQNKFLVLLFMIQAKLNNPNELVFVVVSKEMDDTGINVAAVGENVTLQWAG